MTPPAGPTSWSAAASELGVPVLTASQHSARWLDSVVAGAEDGDGGLADALDAAVGISHELEQWQRLWFGPAWGARQREAKAVQGGLSLDRKPPPGVAREHWEAIVGVMEADPASWDEAAEAMPEAVELLGRLERADPAAYGRLRDAALVRGEEIDRGVRPRLLGQLADLERGIQFRSVWRLVFGPAAGVRPAAPRHLAVHVLDRAGLPVRPAGLFLAHVGLTQTRLDGPVSQLADRLDRLDNEVGNALKSWRSLKTAGRADALRLVEFMEGITVIRWAGEYGAGPTSGE